MIADLSSQRVSARPSNGAGKTSLQRAIAGLERHGGRVTLSGEDVSALPAWQRQRRGYSCVPEGRQIFGGMTVEENLRSAAMPARPPVWSL